MASFTAAEAVQRTGHALGRPVDVVNTGSLNAETMGVSRWPLRCGRCWRGACCRRRTAPCTSGTPDVTA